jgi:hypothetical protein
MVVVMTDQALVEEIYAAASRLLDETDSRDVDGDQLAAAVGHDQNAPGAAFYNACKELDGTRGLHFQFSGGMQVGAVSRQSFR